MYCLFFWGGYDCVFTLSVGIYFNYARKQKATPLFQTEWLIINVILIWIMLHITISDFVHHNSSAHCVLLAVHNVESVLRNGVKLASINRIDYIIGLGRCSDMADGC